MTAPAAALPSTAGDHVGWDDRRAAGLRYGALGLPLAFVALPLYVILPAHYASAYGVPLATLGAVLLAARAVDAVADPWIGRVVDGWFSRSASRVIGAACIAAVVTAAGFHALFFPAVASPAALVAWCFALLVVATFGYSVLAVVHQSWAARLGGDAAQRARIVSWREGLALVGVLVASVLPSVAGLATTSAVFAATLAVALALLACAPRPAFASSCVGNAAAAAPLATRAFRRLLAVYLVNGVAAAVPATLVLFFVRDRLQAPQWEPVFLAGYFAAGALAMPAWLRAVGRIGLARAWFAAMLLAIVTFAWAATLGAGDVVAFAVVCVASGVALGADLMLPGALLAGVIRRAGHGDRLEGAYFGWWNFATKANLAIAAGVALPLLGAFGYATGARDAQALHALTVAYCLLPCALKAVAAALLWALKIDEPAAPAGGDRCR